MPRKISLLICSGAAATLVGGAGLALAVAPDDTMHPVPAAAVAPASRPGAQHVEELTAAGRAADAQRAADDLAAAQRRATRAELAAAKERARAKGLERALRAALAKVDRLQARLASRSDDPVTVTKVRTVPVAADDPAKDPRACRRGEHRDAGHRHDGRGRRH